MELCKAFPMKHEDNTKETLTDKSQASNEALRLYAALVRQLYKHAPIGIVATIANSFILTFILWNVIPHSILISWLSATVSISFLRYLSLCKYWRSSPTSAEACRWATWFIIGIALSGIVWGSAGIFLFSVDSIAHQVFLAFVIGGMVAAAAGTFSIIMKAFLAYSLPALAPIIMRFFVIGDDIHLAMGAMTLLFGLLMFFTAKRVNAAIVSSLKLQFEHSDLINHLAAEKECIEKLNESLNSEVTERKRVEEKLSYRVEFESLITTISTRFIALASDEINIGINQALQEIGEFANVDRSYVFLFSEDATKMDNTHEWCAEGIEPQIDNFKELSVDVFPWWMEKLNRFDNIHIPCVSDLPPEAGAEKEILQPQNIQSLFVVPMVYGGALVGFLGFDFMRVERTWTEEIIALLRVVGEIFVNALRHKRADEKIRNTLTELQEMQDMLVQSEKLAAIGRLTAGVTHEILNPVNIVSMKLQLLQMTAGLLPEAMAEIDICKAQLERIVNILKNLGRFSRIPEKQMHMEDLNNVIENVLALCAPQFKVEDIKTDVRYQPNLPMILLDRERIEKIILNIISNAVAAMKDQERKIIKIITKAEPSLKSPEYIRLIISDTGIGIKNEDLFRLFDPFFTTKNAGEGTGLGLFISYGIIQDYGGKLWAENNKSGGASFIIELPIVKDHDN